MPKKEEVVDRKQVVLAIDPHVRHMACAWVSCETEEVLHVQDFTVSGKVPFREVPFEWGRRMLPEMLALNFGAWYKVAVVIELPDHLKKSLRVERSNQGVQSLVKVAYVAGAVASFFERRGIAVYPTEPRAWKGNKSKAITAWDMACSTNGSSNKWTEHQRDAAAMGLYFVKQRRWTERLPVCA